MRETFGIWNCRTLCHKPRSFGARDSNQRGHCSNKQRDHECSGQHRSQTDNRWNLPRDLRRLRLTKWHPLREPLRHPEEESCCIHVSRGQRHHFQRTSEPPIST